MTQCSTQLSFGGILSTPLAVHFNGGNLNSDNGAVFLRQLDEQFALSSRLAGCLVYRRDSRTPSHLRRVRRQRRDGRDNSFDSPAVPVYVVLIG